MTVDQKERRYFMVIVFAWKTEVREFKHPLGNVYRRVSVEGVEYCYTIKANSSVHPHDKTAHSRADIQAEYHAMYNCVRIDGIEIFETGRLGELVTQKQPVSRQEHDS